VQYVGGVSLGICTSENPGVVLQRFANRDAFVGVGRPFGQRNRGKLHRLVGKHRFPLGYFNKRGECLNGFPVFVRTYPDIAYIIVGPTHLIQGLIVKVYVVRRNHRVIFNGFLKLVRLEVVLADTEIGFSGKLRVGIVFSKFIKSLRGIFPFVLRPQAVPESIESYVSVGVILIFQCNLLISRYRLFIMGHRFGFVKRTDLDLLHSELPIIKGENVLILGAFEIQLAQGYQDIGSIRADGVFTEEFLVFFYGLFALPSSA